MNLIFLLGSLLGSPNMNGDVYYISNPNVSSKPFSTQYQDRFPTTLEYFDVYSDPITTVYGEVFWTVMDPIPLPKEIVQRFQGKPLPIIGYEMNQYLLDGTPLPITWAYNHHYETYLYGGKRVQTIKEYPEGNRYQNQNHGYHNFVYLNQSLVDGKYPTVQLFSEANGGESRASFHGYPKGYAQIVHSPEVFRIQPMQIDTRNRDPRYINDTVFHEGLLPKEVVSPPNASYSGLLECPCTTRIHKDIRHHYISIFNGSCPVNNKISSLNCQKEVELLVGKNMTLYNISDSQSFGGCSFNQSGIYYNFNPINQTCHSDNSEWLAQTTSNNISVILRKNSTHLEINLEGPSQVWYGVAWNAKSMADLPYSIIILGNGQFQERKLGNHDMGQLLPTYLHLESQWLRCNRRNMTFSSPLKTPNFDFTGLNNLPILLAYGSSPQFGYHHNRGSSQLDFYLLKGSTCLCVEGTYGNINGIPFEKNCAPEPIADLLHQRNPTCFLETYSGGLSCCKHKNILLDANQTGPQDPMTYRIKFRFYFEEFQNHQNLYRMYFMTEAYSGEYDVPQAPLGTPPENTIHTITAHFQVKDMINPRQFKNSKGIKMYAASPHCHAATCLSMDLYNADTGDMICTVKPYLGQGNVSVPFDEKDYIRIDPCIWGEDTGLLEAPFFSWDTNLTSIKKCNNTYGHYGEMASWQCRGTIV